MSFPSIAVTVDVNVVLVQLRYKKKKKKNVYNTEFSVENRLEHGFAIENTYFL